jgi:hypothetical protein
MGFSPLAFGRLRPVVASRSRLVVGSQPLLAMSLSCASTTSLTLAASAYVIFGIFGLTAKQPLLSTDPDSPLFLSLHFFFEEMGELAEPRATRLVRKETNNGIRDDNETLDLPAWTTKRELYRRWCHDQGWILKSSDMGNWEKTPREDYEGMFLLCVLLSCS